MKKVLVIGGAGFIGSNLTEHHLSKGCRVIVFDNLSRPGGGAKKNIEYLMSKYKDDPNFEFVQHDVRNLEQLREVMKDVDAVFHVAAQTAMTTLSPMPG
ncbi:MAG: NAD-dependent epimerase/dehydratase family protein [Dehalococcoidia bacterium]|nr:MAG: NAD-dependent epimerase/dehydratase family protein [Dehalococcoidia bacterium]